jgi:hypothetical protein
MDEHVGGQFSDFRRRMKSSIVLSNQVARSTFKRFNVSRATKSVCFPFGNTSGVISHLSLAPGPLWRKIKLILVL